MSLAVDHLGLLSQRISAGRAIRDAKVSARLEHLKAAQDLEEEIRLENIKLAAWAELEEDFRRAAAESLGLDPGEFPKPFQPAIAPTATLEKPDGQDDTDETRRKRKRGTKSKLIAYYESLKGAEFSIADAVTALNATDSGITSETVGSLLSSLKTNGFLMNVGFGRYRQPLRTSSPIGNATGFDSDPAFDAMDDIFSGDNPNPPERRYL